MFIDFNEKWLWAHFILAFILFAAWLRLLKLNCAHLVVKRDRGIKCGGKRYLECYKHNTSGNTWSG
jgi:hypothetical protein